MRPPHLTTPACCRASLALAQDIFNLLPNMNVSSLSVSLAVKGNDMMGLIYLASLLRSVLALHRLIDNKEQRMWAVRRQLGLKQWRPRGCAARVRRCEVRQPASYSCTAGGEGEAVQCSGPRCGRDLGHSLTRACVARPLRPVLQEKERADKAKAAAEKAAKAKEAGKEGDAAAAAAAEPDGKDAGKDKPHANGNA